MPFANENQRPKTRVGEFLAYLSDNLGKRKLLVAGAVLLLCALFFLAGAWYGNGRGAGAKGPGGRKILHYVDPMNPAHTSPEPGLAPCGMKMEPVYADAEGNAPDTTLPPGAVKLNAQRQQLLGVRVTPVEKAPYTFNLRALGKVAVDERLIYRLNAAVDGWILKTFNNSTGAVVKKDEVLATYYSPDFLASQQAYIYGLNQLERFKASGQETPAQIQVVRLNLQQYIDGLENLGMSQLQIQEIAHTRQYSENILMVAPATSFIIARNVSPGQRFDKGTEWYRLADLRRVWVLADLYENEGQYIRPGEKVQVTYPYQKKTFQATVSEVLPIFDPTTRTLKVRLELDNPDYLLRPDMFVDAEFPINLPPTISVPVDAVLDSGLKKTVFVDRGNGYFEPRKVETGWRLGDRVEITRGLQPGEKIVISGNFLIDSESRMKLAAAGMFGEVSQDPVCGMNVDESKSGAKGLKTEVRGHTYYFCSDQCKQQFDTDPARYIAKNKAEQGGKSIAACCAVKTEATPVKEPPGGVKADESQVKVAGHLREHGEQETALPVNARDPVCGIEVDTAKSVAAGLKSQYQGKTYYFCREFCKEHFDRRPEYYIASAEGGQAMKSSAATGGPYVPEAAADPVCGKKVSESLAQALGQKSDYQGKTYFFCSDKCKEKFDRAPGQYLGQAAAPAPGSGGPDVVKAQARKTSKDPVCGMDVDEASATEAGRTSKYQGKTYYFCAEVCKQRFDNAPQSFLGKTAAGHGQENAPSHPVAQETPATTRDPVCNLDVRAPIAKAIAPKTVYQGRTYYFCSELCKQVFDKNPERFVGKAAERQLTESGPRGYLAITAEAGAGRSPGSSPPGQAQPGAAPPGSPPGAMAPGMPMAPPAQTPAMPMSGGAAPAMQMSGGQTPGAPMDKDIPRDIRGRPMGHATMRGAAGSIAAAPDPAGTAAKPPAPAMPMGGHQAQSTATGPKDPVCGMVLEENQVKNTPWKSELHGKTYYFCSQKCKQEFDQDPERYQGEKAEGAGVVKQTMRMPAAQPGAGGQQHD
jgi:Cu(I)/Ag(I) efflux system membrane fusion protein